MTMEATGIYWRPIFHALCAAERAAGGVVGQRPARQERPGSQERCPRRGVAGGVDRVRVLRGSFIPPPQIAAIRELTRYRKKLIEQRASELQRLGKVLEDSGIKIDSVASTLTTVSAREMIEALINGERDPPCWPIWPRGDAQEDPRAEDGVRGRFGDQHALMCTLHLEHIDHLTDMIARLDTRIDEASLLSARRSSCWPRSRGSVNAPPRSSSPK